MVGLIEAGVYEFASVSGAESLEGAAVSSARRSPLDSLRRCRNTATTASEKWTAS